MQTSFYLECGIAVLQGLIVDGALAADKLRAHARGQQNRRADVILRQTDGDGDLLQVHADERTADVKTRVRADFLERHGVAESIVGGGCEGAAHEKPNK